MARSKSNNVQINISIPSEWKTQLENLARIYSVEEGKTITFLDLMRRGIQEKYQLGEEDNERVRFRPDHVLPPDTSWHTKGIRNPDRRPVLPADDRRVWYGRR